MVLRRGHDVPSRQVDTKEKSNGPEKKQGREYLVALLSGPNMTGDE